MDLWSELGKVWPLFATAHHSYVCVVICERFAYIAAALCTGR